MTTPIGLAANKVIMDQKFGSLTKPQVGEMYNAAYNAYKNLASAALLVSDDSENKDPDLLPMIAKQRAAAKNQIEIDANKFAKDLCDGISTMLNEIATQIDAHCKSMVINIITTTPGPSGTVLTGATGPVTGTIAANNLTPTGGITVN